MEINTKLFLTYGLLMCSILSIWIDFYLKQKIKINYLLLLLSAIFGLTFNFINVFSFMLIVIMVVILSYKNKITNSFIPGILLFIISVLMFLHKFPGFNNYMLITKKVLSQNAVPYSMYLNFDKALVGIFIINYFGGLATSLEEWKDILKKYIGIGSATILLVITISFLFKYIKFDPKLISFLPIWIITNLLFVCIPEEAFFRGFLQKNISNFFNFEGGGILAIIIGALIFGLGHFSGGIKYILLATVAGFGYGYAFYKTKRIETSILIHFSLNLIHICFFTYPSLI